MPICSWTNLIGTKEIEEKGGVQVNKGPLSDGIPQREEKRGCESNKCQPPYMEGEPSCDDLPKREEGGFQKSTDQPTFIEGEPCFYDMPPNEKHCSNDDIQQNKSQKNMRKQKKLFEPMSLDTIFHDSAPVSVDQIKTPSYQTFYNDSEYERTLKDVQNSY